MGSGNSVNINMNLDRAESFFYAGESVSGAVNVNIAEGDIKMDEVLIVLKGETGYTTTRTVQDSSGSSRTETDYHTICFFSEKQILDSRGPDKKDLVYHSGQYSWRFDISLPSNLPPSINQPRKYPHVRYYVKFIIDKPWYKPNKDKILYLTVFPHINLSSDSQLFVSSMFGDHNRKDVSLKGTIDKLGYVAGEMITGILQIENPRRISVKQIHLSLVQHSRIECNTHKETIIKLILPTVNHNKEEYMQEKFSLLIPQIYLAPTYQFMGGFDHRANVNIGYMLEFGVKVEGMFTNFDVNIPITIGTESEINLNRHTIHNASNLYPNSISYYPETIDDPPYVRPDV